MTAAQQPEPTKRVWIQLAEVGAFKGHPQGPFDLSPATFDTICRNFARDGLPIPIDFEHASEMPPTSGTIPAGGAPAIGWIHQLDNRKQAGLWGQVEWLEPARSYIKEGKYKYISPAIRFKSKDRVTGEQTGPRLSSAGATNSPFLPNLKPLTASAKSVRDGESVYVCSVAVADDLASSAAVEEPAVTLALGAMCYSAHEYMPRIKSALGMHELSNAMECSDRLGQLRDHLESVNGDHTKMPEGVDLAKYLLPLRSMTNAPMGSTWDDVFDTVQDMIDSAMEQHVAEYHEGDPASMSNTDEATPAVALSASPEPAETAPASTAPAPVSVAADEPAPTLDAQEPPPVVASTAAAELVTVTEPTAAAAPAAAAPELQPITEAASEPAPPKETIMATNASPETAAADVTLLSLKLQTAESELELVKQENAALLSWKESRIDQDLIAEVSVAFETHRERMKLKPDQKTSMLSLLKANPDDFRKMFPATPMAHRHLLQTIATNERAATAAASAPRVQADLPAPTTEGAPIVMNFRDLSRAIMVKKGIPLGAAQQEAQRMLKAQRQRAANG